jgi:hypothetical protein
MEEIYNLKKQGYTWKEIQKKLKKKRTISALSLALKRYCDRNNLELIDSRGNAGRKKITYHLKEEVSGQYLPNDKALTQEANNKIQKAAYIYKELFNPLDQFEKSMVKKYDEDMAQVNFDPSCSLENEADRIVEKFNLLKKNLT